MIDPQIIQGPLRADVEIILPGHKVPYYLDKEIFVFAVRMQNMLNKHAEKKGDSWKDMTQHDVGNRLSEECMEVLYAMQKIRTPEQRKHLADEYTDVALFAMFGATLTEDNLPV